eukprot:TRINITY_DN4001_c0_g1_i1.p1 TRINITY_DN4001_c0_g1~~TRINITY_DN4001_c0_g1_i1.p1  ORF type:complete len:473 (+),score=151.14 TRINITY_DN4001_c0_g1_i1:313-1731(+)
MLPREVLIRFFFDLKTLLGEKFESEAVKRFQGKYPQYKVQKDSETGGVLFNLGGAFSEDVQQLSVEELLAIIMKQGKEIASSYGQLSAEQTRDVVLSVPPFWGNEKRERLRSVAELAGFRVLNVLSDLTAAAVDFASTRTFEKPQYSVFYGMGSIGASAILVKFSQHTNGSRVVEVLKSESDNVIGGQSFDFAIADYLADQFDKQKSAKTKEASNIRKNVRALTKLRLYANELKESLSAVESEDVNLESLDGDNDLVLTFTRQNLEEICDKLFQQAVAPLTRLLESIDNKKDVSYIELFGGGLRVPKVQSLLQKYDIPLGVHVNGEEGVAFGSAFYGAVQKKTVPVHILVTDPVTHTEATTALPSLSPSALKRSEERIRLVEEKEKQRERSVEAKNEFETYLYEAKDKVEEREKSKHISEAQKDELMGVLAQEEEWLGDNGNVNQVTADVYSSRLSELKTKLSSIAKLKEEL